MPEESRIERKLDKLLDQQVEQIREMSKIYERLTKVETLVKERTDDNKEVHDRLKDLEERMGAVEKHKTRDIGAKDVILGSIGVVAAAIAAWGGAEIMWDINRIISLGLVIMGVISVGGWLAISLKTGTSTGTEIPIGIISGLVGVLTGKGLAEAKGQQSKTAETLSKIEETAKRGQQIVDAVDGLKDVFGKKDGKL